MTHIYLIRHAENDYVGKKLAGWKPGVHLNEKGRRQAQALAERLAGVRLEAVYSSPLERAIETAAPLAQARRLPILRRPALGEVKYGEWTGRSLKALARTRLWRVVQFRPSAVRFPGGETFPELQMRVVGALEAIRAEHPKGAVAVVSHGDAIRVAVAHYLGVHLDLFQRIMISPASITILHLSDGLPRLLRLNDTGPMIH